MPTDANAADENQIRDDATPDGASGDLILIAEDEPDIRDLAVHVLERAGYSTITFGDGESALAGARERSPALCLLDVMMPRMNGFQVLRELKGSDATSAIPAIMCTATIQDERDVRQAGPSADGYLRKPFTTAELQAAVDSLLA